MIEKIFVCEFITAGGFNHANLPNTLLSEAALMRDALLFDLSLLPYHVTITLDARLNAPETCDDYGLVGPKDDVWMMWEAQIKLADAVWIIAPETNGILKKLTDLVAHHNVITLGCGPLAINAFSSKLTTFLVCEQAGIATIPTYTLKNWPELVSSCPSSKYLAKPDDGAGCDDTVFFETSNDLNQWMLQNNKQHSHIIQPFLNGISASISCVVLDGTAIVLSCNEQRVSCIRMQNNYNKLQFEGLTLNTMQGYWAQFEILAQQVAKLIPDLKGYIGIDVIVHNNKITLMEVNPRLTTAYVGLREATGLNPAELIINTLTKTLDTWPIVERNVVHIHV